MVILTSSVTTEHVSLGEGVLSVPFFDLLRVVLRVVRVAVVSSVRFRCIKYAYETRLTWQHRNMLQTFGGISLIIL